MLAESLPRLSNNGRNMDGSIRLIRYIRLTDYVSTRENAWIIRGQLLQILLSEVVVAYPSNCASVFVEGLR
jgi:hypothetical protein